MDDKEIHYILNVEKAEFTPGDPGVKEYVVECRFTASVEPCLIERVAQKFSQHNGIVVSGNDNPDACNPLKKLNWTVYAAFSIGIIAGCWLVWKLDKDGHTIGHVAKKITTAAKAVSMTANGATTLINQWKT